MMRRLDSAQLAAAKGRASTGGAGFRQDQHPDGPLCLSHPAGSSSRSRRNPRGVKRKMSNFPLRRRTDKPLPPVDIKKAIKVLK